MKKTTKMEILTLLFLLINILKTSAQDSRKPFSQSSYPSLPYVEVVSLGTVRFIWGRYEIVSYFDLDEFSEEEGIIGGKIKEVETACKNFSSCQHQHLIERLKHQLRECVESKLKMFSMLSMNSVYEKKNGANNNRQKRSDDVYWFEWVGDISQFSFGTLTADDRRRYEKLIGDLNGDLKNLAMIHKNHTAVMKMVFDKFAQVSKGFDKNIEILDKRMEMIDGEVRKSAQFLAEVEMNILITKECFEIEIAVMKLDKKINIVLESITMGRNGTINPKLLKPKELVEGITAIMKEQKPVNIPIELHEENYFEFLDISEIAIDVLNRSLVYVVKVPVLQSESWSAYQILPVPKSLNNGSAIVFVDIEHEYIITDEHQTQFISADNNFLRDCKKYKSFYFCDEAAADIKQETTDTCWKAVLGSDGKIDEQICQYKMVNASKSLWIPLPNGNEWVYVVNVEERILILCEEGPEPVTVYGTRKLTVKPGCVVVGEGLKLSSTFDDTVSNNYTISVIDFHFKENLTLFENSNLNYSSIVLPKIEKQVIKPGDFIKLGDGLDVVMKKVQNVRDKIEEEESKWSFSFPWWQLILMGLAGFLYIFIIFRKCCCELIHS